MAHWLLREEGMFVGSSSAFNVSGAVRVARRMLTEGKREGGRGGGTRIKEEEGGYGDMRRGAEARDQIME